MAQFRRHTQHTTPNRIQQDLLFHGSERLDVATFLIGLEYMKINKPKLIHFGFGKLMSLPKGLYDFYMDMTQIGRLDQRTL